MEWAATLFTHSESTRVHMCRLHYALGPTTETCVIYGEINQSPSWQSNPNCKGVAQEFSFKKKGRYIERLTVAPPFIQHYTTACSWLFSRVFPSVLNTEWTQVCMGEQCISINISTLKPASVISPVNEGLSLFVSQVQMLMVLSWQVAEVMTELWKPHAKLKMTPHETASSR